MYGITYRMDLQQSTRHILDIELHIAKPDAQGQVLWLPNWIPGSYMIRDFARHVVALAAYADGRALVVEKLDKNHWRLPAAIATAVQVRYQVYAWDLSVRGAHFDQRHAYFNGAAVFLAVAGQEDRPHRLQLSAVAGTFTAPVAVATRMPAYAVDADGWGEYGCDHYAGFIDYPFEVGRWRRGCARAEGVLHEIVVSGSSHFDMARLERDIAAITATCIRFFAQPAPFTHYLFLLQAVGNGYGGLEHADSCSLLLARRDLPAYAEAQEPGTHYRALLGLICHEYFHAWNVKRLRPAALAPYALQQEVHTPLLWFFEGVTSYYDDLLLLRAERIGRAAYLELLGQQITRYLRQPGRAWQSVAESSFDAWSKYYRQDENSANVQTSYYIHGALVALCLDLELRRQRPGRASLDDVMRDLYARFGQHEQGLVEADIVAALERQGGEALVQCHARWVHGREDLPLVELLAAQGIRMHLRAAESAQDAGGSPGQGVRRLSLGGRWKAVEGGLLLLQVAHDGALERAGLAAQDVIVALAGLRVSEELLETLLTRQQVDDKIVVYAFRGDELLQVDLYLQEAPADTCFLEWASEVLEAQAWPEALGEDQ